MDILIVDDEKVVRESTRIALEMDDHYVEAVSDGSIAMHRLKEEAFDLVLIDLNLGNESGLDFVPAILKRYPRTAVVVFTAEGTISSAVQAIHAGAMDYLEKPISRERLRSVVARARHWCQLHERIEKLETEISAQSPPPLFESKDSSMKETLELLFRAAATPASILILGESGTGKSLVANEAHRRSLLHAKPFVTVSCPSLSKELLESELFGHVKGSFTGAIRDRWGKVHAANGGTLFLDEIGELPLDVQPKLLRLLQEREYERLGESKTRHADVRVIAATNRDLRKCVAEGTFREDLYYRLDVITITMPPLRERLGDLRHFAEKYLAFFVTQSRREVEGFSEDAMLRIMSHEWPGNLRELRNAIERAVILSQGTRIEADDLPSPHTDVNHSDRNDESFVGAGAPVSLEALEAEHIRRVIARVSNLKQASRVLGIDQATLYRKRKKLGV